MNDIFIDGVRNVRWIINRADRCVPFSKMTDINT